MIGFIYPPPYYELPLKQSSLVVDPGTKNVLASLYPHYL